MSQHVILNNIEHKTLTVVDQRHSSIDNQHMCAALTLSELRSAIKDYPILFYRGSEEAAPEPMAIFGFEKNENLFATEQGWADFFIPAIVHKGPFKIGHQPKPDGEVDQVITIDIDDARVNHVNGVPLFLNHGGHSDYLTSMLDHLHRLSTERPLTLAFGKMLVELDLLDQVNIEFPVGSDNTIRLTGFMTINEEKLNQLKGDTLERLANQGFLQAAYFCAASMANLGALIKRKQHKASI